MIKLKYMCHKILNGYENCMYSVEKSSSCMQKNKTSDQSNLCANRGLWVFILFYIPKLNYMTIGKYKTEIVQLLSCTSNKTVPFMYSAIMC